jgi:septation ring formation regulator EzrA
MVDRLAGFIRRILELESKFDRLADRVSVLEVNTTSWDCRIEDLEDWQEKVDDHLDKIDEEL